MTRTAALRRTCRMGPPVSCRKTAPFCMDAYGDQWESDVGVSVGDRLCLDGRLSSRSETFMAKQAVSNIRRWAVIGAEQRIVQLTEEAAAIYRVFPELSQPRGSGTHFSGTFEDRITGVSNRRGRGRKRKRRMSAAARR